MKKISFFITSSALVFLPLISSAQTGFLGGGTGGEIGGALTTIMSFMNNVLIPFLLAIGFFMFVWGIIKYFIIGGDNDDAKASGKSLIIYALAGFVVILAFWGIVNILTNGVGLSDETLDETPISIVAPS